MIAAILTVLAAILRPIGEYLVDPIKNQASYLCCYSRNVRRLACEAPELNTRKDSVEQDVDAAEDNLEVIRPEVKSWLIKAEKVQTDSSRICKDAAEVQERCLSKWCPLLHYSLSREAQKATEASVELRNTRFERISNPVNPADLEPIPAASEIHFESRESMENEIMDALKDASVYLIGLCGMGGVGKTTMAEKIERRVRDMTLFERVVMTDVSEQLDLSKVQQKIAERLGLSLVEEDLGIRARKLHSSLKNTSSVLIILDDVWERLILEKIGIPSQSTHPGCKLILTSRDRKAMTTTAEDAKIFQLQVLNDKEAWVLFKKNAGGSIDSPDLHKIAEKVAKECKGLPLALEVVGRALKGESKSCWADALRGLKQSTPVNIPDVLKHVYGPLLVSVDKLGRNENRYLFLLCCLFPEDYIISHEELVRYGMGLGIFDGVEDLSQARNRVESIAKFLISRSLLIECRNWRGDPCVKMHDVVRDIGIYVKRHEFLISHGKEEWPKLREDSCSNYSCISLTFSKGDFGFPECIDCPRLELLTMSFGGGHLKAPENFFTGTTALKVLEVNYMKSLPSSIHLLKGLRTLRLYRCTLGMVSVIGELRNLEILCLELCQSIEALPEDIGGLKKLRKLDLIDSGEVRIAFGVISGLVRLEELAILGSFQEWQSKEEDKEASCASLVELDSLRHLTTLSIEISNPNAIPERMPHWVHKLKKYSISVPTNVCFVDRFRFDKFISLGDVVTPLRDWFYDHFARDAQYLYLDGLNCRCVVNKLIRSRCRNLISLRLRKFENVKYLGHAVIEDRENDAIFPVLKTLRIDGCCSFEEVCNGTPPIGSFKALEEIELWHLSGLMRFWTFSSEMMLPNLKSVEVRDCQSLPSLFPLSIAESLSNFERLEVSCCPVMKEIFQREQEITVNRIKFPKLSELTLSHLPGLRGFCKGVDRVEIPGLRELVIKGLSSLIREGDNNIQQQFLFDQEVASNSLQFRLLLPALDNINFNFSGFQSLTVESLHNVKSLFSPSLVSGFSNLRMLAVRSCSKLEQVIGKEEINHVSVGETEARTILFPRLRQLHLKDMPELLAFCHSMGDLQLPLLEKVYIENCPVMETFVRPLFDVSLPRISNSKYIGQSFFTKEVLCPKLFYLYLDRINATLGIFSESIPIDRFSGLRHLEVIECKELQEVIDKGYDEEPPTNIIAKETLFPQLQFLGLRRLPKMQRFCHIKKGLELPMLETVLIEDCPMLKTFSLGSLHLPSLKRVRGIQDCDFGAKFFFHKEKSCNEILLENNCFTISARDLSLNSRGREFNWTLRRDSSDSFFAAVELLGIRRLKITGNFEMVKLQPKVAYEIILITLDEYGGAQGWEAQGLFKLSLPGGVPQYQREIREEKSSCEWVETLLGEFMREPCQVGQLEFSLSLEMNIYTRPLLIKGFKIQLKA